MTGYVVEVDPEIETALSSVMPGVTWKTWTPFFMQESDNLIDSWVGRVVKFLAELKDDRISSQALKKKIGGDKVAPDTWTAIIRKFIRNAPKKEHMGEYGTFGWTIEGRSLVRVTAASYGFTEEAV